jgi:hypothetical protein
LAWGFSFSRQGLQRIEDGDLLPEGPQPEDEVFVRVPGGFQAEKDLLGPGLRHSLRHLREENVDAVRGVRKLERRDEHLPEEGHHPGGVMIRGHINGHIQQLLQAIGSSGLSQLMSATLIDACRGGHVPLHRNG